MPPLSIITPMYNRAALIGRCVESCLGQDEGGFELIVVDDGSTDGSAQVVERYRDPRITLLRHARNRGVSPARNTGVRAARGDWVLLLDSDDALVPGALRTVRRAAREAKDGVGRLGFMYRLDQGGFSPEPPLRQEIWSYEDFLRWSGEVSPRTDFVNCIRRAIFAALPFAEDRSSESLYYLDFARRHQTQTFPEVIATLHSDAANRSLHYSVSSLRTHASDQARAQSQILERHGDALRRVAPARYRRELRIAAIEHFLAGDRFAGSRCAARLFRERTSPDVVALLALGLIGSTAVAAAMVARAARRG